MLRGLNLKTSPVYAPESLISCAIALGTNVQVTHLYNLILDTNINKDNAPTVLVGFIELHKIISNKK